MNSALLKRLASESGGRYYTPDNAGTIAEDISYIDKGSSSHLEEKELWDMPFLFLLLVGLNSAEWSEENAGAAMKRNRLATMTAVVLLMAHLSAATDRVRAGPF